MELYLRGFKESVNRLRRASVLLVLTASAVFLYPAEPGRADDSPRKQPSTKKNVDFQRDVKPVLAKHCFECHGADAQESELRLDLRPAILKGGESGKPAIVVGKSAQSILIQRVTATDADLRMPPEGKPLTAEQINILKTWIDQGAIWPKEQGGSDRPLKLTTDFWSFQPLKKLRPPKSDNQESNNPIDAFLLSKLKLKGLQLSPPADRTTLIRRLYLDMLGLPPTPEEVDAFRNDKRVDAYPRLVRKVLSSPHYGERWARHWLDVVRFAETDGFEMNQERPNAWHYRDYVIEAFNTDKPYRQFIVEQIAGDAVGADAATGFLVGGPYDQVKSPDITLTLMQRQDELADIINTTGTTFLGLTLGCAKCHSHKFDPIPQKDYYALQAIFAGVLHGERPLRGGDDTARKQKLAEVHNEIALVEQELKKLGVRPSVNAKTNEERFAPIKAKFVRFTIHATNNNSEPCIDELEIYASASEQNLALAADGAEATASGTYPGSAIHKLVHIHDGKHGNSRSWISNERGKGWVQIELKEITAINRIVWGRDREEKYKDRLPVDYIIETAVKPGQWQTVVSSKGRLPFGTDLTKIENIGLFPAETVKKIQPLLKNWNELRKQQQQLSTALPMVYAGKFEQPKPIHRLYRGDPLSPREVVPPNALSVIRPLNLTNETPEQQRRLALAKWIVDPQNPLTARVMVNRIWHYHFGTGIVETPSDFGKNGGRPSHPKLLDWLAGEFIVNDWSIKHIQRLILLSNTYRQSSRPNEQALSVDAGSRLLWRFPPRRLEAEIIRDQMLFVSGALNKKQGGPGFSVFEPNSNYVRNYIPKKEFGPNEWRRMIYVTKVRMEQDAVFGAFDCPDAGQVAPRRNRSTTAIQALNLFNSRFTQQQSDLFAERLVKEVGENIDKQVNRAFQITFGRIPDATESAAAIRLVQTNDLPALCRALFNTNEFLFLP